MKNSRFETKSFEGSVFSTQYSTIVDKITGVNYLFIKSGYGAGLTPLLDENGKPVVTKKED